MIWVVSGEIQSYLNHRSNTGTIQTSTIQLLGTFELQSQSGNEKVIEAKPSLTVYKAVKVLSYIIRQKYKQGWAIAKMGEFNPFYQRNANKVSRR